MKTCDICGRERTDQDPDYEPLQLLTLGTRIGWYSGDDGEICGADMQIMFQRANR